MMKLFLLGEMRSVLFDTAVSCHINNLSLSHGVCEPAESKVDLVVTRGTLHFGVDLFVNVNDKDLLFEYCLVLNVY